MKVVFKENDKNLEKKIDYGTILLCKNSASDEKFTLYRVSRPYDEVSKKITPHVLHDADNYECAIWSAKYNNVPDMIENLKGTYDVIKVVDAHIVIDKVIGTV